MKELECKLHCKATAKLSMSVAHDFNKKDGSLEKLLAESKKEENDTENQPDTDS